MSQPPAEPNPTRYCRWCSYVLDGLTAHRCPECGRTFDPNRRRTYRTKPRGSLWSVLWVLVRASAIGVAVLMLVLVMTLGLLYWRYSTEQEALSKLEVLGFRYSSRPLGPLGLTLWPTKWDLPFLETVVHLHSYTANDDGLKYVRSFPNLRDLALKYSLVTDEGLAHLKGMTQLRSISLQHSQVTENGVTELKRMLPGVKVTWFVGGPRAEYGTVWDKKTRRTIKIPMPWTATQPKARRQP